MQAITSHRDIGYIPSTNIPPNFPSYNQAVISYILYEIPRKTIYIYLKVYISCCWLQLFKRSDFFHWYPHIYRILQRDSHLKWIMILKKQQLQNESPSDIKIRARGMDDDNPNRCIKASITPNLIINRGVSQPLLTSPQTSWVIKCPHWTSPNQNRYMVNAMATFSGDVQYCQNGLPTPEHVLSFLVGGIPTPLKNMKVSWDDDIPNIWKVIKFMFQTTNQFSFAS